MKYSELPKSENPRNRIREFGGSALSLSEVLSVALWIVDTEQSEELSNLYIEHGGLSFIPRHEIMKIKGLGERCADSIEAISELVKREIRMSKPERVIIGCPADAAGLVNYEMSSLEQEQLRVILVNTRNEVIRIVTLYQGTVDSSPVRVSEIMRDAIRENASGFIVVHNHPSGDPSPSPEDIHMTKEVNKAAKIMDIAFLDHIIIGHGRWTSLKERGLGF